MSHSATAMIKEDHLKVEQLYQRYQGLSGQATEKRALAEQICHELEVHAKLEEGIFYPAVQAKLGGEGNNLVKEAISEHNEMKRMIGQVRASGNGSGPLDTSMQKLMQGVQHHVSEEESYLLPKAEQHMAGELTSLGEQMQKRKQELGAGPSSAGKSNQGTLAGRKTAATKDTSESSIIEQSIDVNVPVRTAYNQWTQFEEFPEFMDGVEQVTQIDDTHLHWKAKVGGKIKEWDAVITEQTPDQRIAWTNTTGARNAGVVTFHRLAEKQTRIMLQLEYEPEGMVENVGDVLGVVSSRVSKDLKRFKEFIESRQVETGAWRGSVEQRAK
jgi:uncharacterized membrane protein/hemerythrin-like domain-containing protein